MDPNWWEGNCPHCRCNHDKYEPGSIDVPLPQRVSKLRRREQVKEELIKAEYELGMIQIFTVLGIGDGSA